MSDPPGGPPIFVNPIPADSGSGAQNTVTLFRPVPIIFVPGVMGSRIHIDGGLTWDPDDAGGLITDWALANLETVRTNLSVDDNPKASAVQSLGDTGRQLVGTSAGLARISTLVGQDTFSLYEDRGWGGVAASFYVGFLDFLETSLNFAAALIQTVTNPVFAFGYDFRQSNFISGDKLAAFIQQVVSSTRGARDVVVVTHSMGGLALRAALARHPEVIPLIRGVVHGALPSNGAVVAYRRFFTGMSLAFDGDTFFDGLFSIEARVLGLIVGDNPVAYRILQSGLPGPMQLLPNNLFSAATPKTPWLVDPKTAINLNDIFNVYRRTDNPGLIFPQSPSQFPPTNTLLLQRIGEAEAFHRQVATVAHPNTHVLFSTGVRTDVQSSWSPVPSRFGSRPLNVIKGTPGDGTVPVVSGRCPSFPAGSVQNTQSVNGIEHSAVYGDTNFQKLALQAVLTIIQSKLFG